METIYNDTADRSISITATLNAPIETVWAAWTQPEQIAAWWGPNGFTNTIHTMDVVTDGRWHLTMHGPDGKDYPNKSIFKEIIPLQKITYQHFNPNYLATITFKPHNNQTLITWHMLFDTAALFETVVKVFKADKGLEENIEKLKAYLNQA